ncbi:uncharacterized protein B0H18DRAFT_1070679, partial [Fomitopsis serialis]|uniref:uncharacterized protein n=1 Tax=Fomitopsis serialis TaxID=139415 RepID=UPI0020074D0B
MLYLVLDVIACLSGANIRISVFHLYWRLASSQLEESIGQDATANVSSLSSPQHYNNGRLFCRSESTCAA